MQHKITICGIYICDMGLLAFDVASCSLTLSQPAIFSLKIPAQFLWMVSNLRCPPIKFPPPLSTFWQVEETSSGPPNEFPQAHCLLLATCSPFLLEWVRGRWRRSPGPGGMEGGRERKWEARKRSRGGEKVEKESVCGEAEQLLNAMLMVISSLLHGCPQNRRPSAP